MKLHYKGKYDLNPDHLPHGEHKANAVPFKEAKDSKTMAIIGNVASVIILIAFGIPVFFRCRDNFISIHFFLAFISTLLVLFPHELLHAICFKEDVYLFTNLKHGMLFVVGPEIMTKGRFVFMSLFPNIVFGFIPYIIGMVFPELSFFSVFGAICASMGAGDYYNVFNAVTQMPKGSKTYLYKFNSFWFMSE